MTPESPEPRESEPRHLPDAPAAAAVVYGEQLPLAVRYAEELADTGVSHGLIGPREAERLWVRHVLNCAVVGEFVPHGATVVDVGSGAGLSGIALAIARPDLQVHLVEPLARRVTWLERVLHDLDLPRVTVHRGRAQEVDVVGDVVTARAVSKLSTLAGWMAPLACPDALMLALKGSSAPDELERDRRAAQRAGWSDLEVVHAGAELLDPPTTVIRGRRQEDRKGRRSGRRRAPGRS